MDRRAGVILTSTNAPTTERLAAALARQCVPGDCILLHGDLGAGKTTFARGFIQALQAAPEEVLSPTFTLVQTYALKDGGQLWHFDLYRLKEVSELTEIGLEDALAEGITLIEWPEIAQSRLPNQALTVTLETGKHADERRFTFTGAPGHWQARLDRLKDIV